MKIRVLSPAILSAALIATGAGVSGADIRLEPPKNLDAYFPWSPPTTKAAWETRARELREQMKVALGLWPEPPRTPLNAVVHGKIELDDYTVEKVYFESVPGFFVTGNLYRPKSGVGSVGADGRRAGVLCPHGHWSNGRFTDAGDAPAKEQIAKGAEKLDAAAHSPLQARCVQLARMGCVVFHHDMIGYADSVQIGMEVAHGFAKQDPAMNAEGGWGFFTPRAEAWMQSIMGLQTWNCIRALDFLTSLPEVDPARLGVTGASGGGTQTFILGAVDPRPAAIFPAVMVSTAMQGGCTCENASLLRVGTGNIEITALFAPKPCMMSAADDWTKEMPAKGFPQLKEHWTRLGAPDNVALIARLEFEHNYNLPSRDAMCAWFNKHLGLGLPPEKLVERDFRRLTREEMSVWDAAHPAPSGENAGATLEKKLTRWLADAAAEQVKAKPDLARSAWRHVVGRTFATAGDDLDFDTDAAQKTEHADHTEFRGPIVNESFREEVQAVMYHPNNWNGSVLILLSAEDSLDQTAKDALKNGTGVVHSKLFRPGEKNRPVAGKREAPCYTYGYNRTLFAQRVHDVLTILKFGLTHENHPVKSITIHADGPTYFPIASLALHLTENQPVTLSSKDRAFPGIQDSYLEPNFVPGWARYPVPGVTTAAQ